MWKETARGRGRRLLCRVLQQLLVPAAPGAVGVFGELALLFSKEVSLEPGEEGGGWAVCSDKFSVFSVCDCGELRQEFPCLLEELESLR